MDDNHCIHSALAGLVPAVGCQLEVGEAVLVDNDSMR